MWIPSSSWVVVVGSWDGDVLVLVKFDIYDNKLFQIDINGKLVASFHRIYFYCA